MQRSLVMTIIGLDRPGLVGSIAGSVAAHGGNWLESRMSHLGGHFAGILRVEVPAENEVALTKALESLTASGLTVVIHRDASPAASQPARVNKLEIVGQ